MTDFNKILDKAKELEIKMKESQSKIRETTSSFPNGQRLKAGAIRYRVGHLGYVKSNRWIGLPHSPLCGQTSALEIRLQLRLQRGSFCPTL